MTGVAGAAVRRRANPAFGARSRQLAVSHQGQFPAVTLSFNLSPKVALGDAVRWRSRRRSADGQQAARLSARSRATAQAFQDSLCTQPYLILAAIVAVYIILGMLYESYIHPITILSTLPSAGVGALLILVVSGFDLSVMAMIGIILLIGIVKKNAIMMIDFALQIERREGVPPRKRSSGLHVRFRPIMMTTMAALLGGLPLMLGQAPAPSCASLSDSPSSAASSSARC